MQTSDLNLNPFGNTGYPAKFSDYLGDFTFTPSPDATYTHHLDEESGEDNFTVPNRNALFELIRDITKSISEGLTQRFTSCPDHHAPFDDETFDIHNAIDLLTYLKAFDEQD